jgi:hypothetical protein
MSKTSVQNLLNGQFVGQLFPTSTLQNPQNNTNNTNNEIQTTQNESTTPTESSLSLGDICRTSGENSTSVAIANMVDQTFLDDLDKTLRGNQPIASPYGSTYGATNISKPEDTTPKTAASDFFAPVRCSGPICIKVQFQTQTKPLL